MLLSKTTEKAWTDYQTKLKRGELRDGELVCEHDEESDVERVLLPLGNSSRGEETRSYMQQCTTSNTK
jgi:hypothetical protein